MQPIVLERDKTRLKKKGLGDDGANTYIFCHIYNDSVYLLHLYSFYTIHKVAIFWEHLGNRNEELNVCVRSKE